MQAFVDHIHDRPYRHAQRRHTRVKKIPCHKSHEIQNGKDRRTYAYNATHSYMETMENSKSTGMETSQTRD